MRVMLNASALSGVIIFTVCNIMGMNLGTGPNRLQGIAGFAGSTFMGYPLFLVVWPAALLDDALKRIAPLAACCTRYNSQTACCVCDFCRAILARLMHHWQ